jgi:hypothetical protein
MLDLANGLSGRAKKDERVICVLKNGAGGIRNERMVEVRGDRGIMEKPP